MKDQNNHFAINVNWLRIIIFSIFVLYGCKDNKIKESNFERHSFHIFTSDRVEKKIYESKGQKFELGYFVKSYYGNTKYKVDKIEIRGQSALNFRRKSYYVNVNGKLPFYTLDSMDTLYLNKFILSAMTMDFTYIENKISHYLLKEVDLWFLNSFYVELYINNKHQGVYLLMEDPKEFAFKKMDASFLLRRLYDHNIEKYTEKSNGNLLNTDLYIAKFKRLTSRILSKIIINNKMNLHISDPYVDKFNRIYSELNILKGKELYDSLSNSLDLDSYFKKIAMDEILENGDYTDEIFFYSTSKKNENIKFDIMVWDYDDIFSSSPHEVGRRDSLCGKCFGLRVYPTYQDFQLETKGKLLFSIEDDLDYIIMKDDFLYSKYLEKLEEILTKFDDKLINGIFDQVQNELMPFYNVTEVIEQSTYDDQKTNLSIFSNNLIEKKIRLINRLNWLREEIKNQKLSVN